MDSREITHTYDADKDILLPHYFAEASRKPWKRLSVNLLKKRSR